MGQGVLPKPLGGGPGPRRYLKAKLGGNEIRGRLGFALAFQFHRAVEACHDGIIQAAR